MNPLAQVLDQPAPTTPLQIAGALGFGLLIGWYIYYINRYRRGDIQWSDLVTLVGIIGGTAILALFPQGTDLFGAYGVGLAVGFFSYFIALIIMVRISKNFTVDWFLDGRRKLPDKKEYLPEVKTDVGGVGMVATRDETDL